MTGFEIGHRRVGDGSPCLVVAEVAQAHDGSLGMAHAYIDAVAEAGADAVKFQYHLGDQNERWRIKPEWPQDSSRKAYWSRTTFTLEELRGLAAHVLRENMLFLCSPFSALAVEALAPLVPAWKVPSGQMSNLALFEAIERTRKPVILSSGMSTWAELSAAVDRLSAPKAVLQCTSSYPTKANEVGLPNMLEMRERFGCPVGLSDHTGTLGPSLGAVALGASIVEVHVCFPGAYSLDAEASLTPKQLKRLVKYAWEIEQALKPVEKDAMAERLEPMRSTFMPRAYA